MGRPPKNMSNESPQRSLFEDREQTDDQSRALGLFAGYLWSKFGISQSELSPTTLNLSSKVTKRFREGNYQLTPFEFDEMRLHFANLLLRPSINTQVVRDYAWVRPLLIACDLDRELNRNHRILGPLDREFLRSLNLSSGRQDAEIINGIMGGLWHIIRLSTDRYGEVEPGIFNVSLLNIKPTTYVKYNEETEHELVETELPHFSLRSRFRSRARIVHQTFRGRVFIVDKTIYLLGDRGQDSFAPRIFVMALAIPHVPEDQTHADMAHGVIMAITSHDTPIMGPVSTQYIRNPSTVVPGGRPQSERASDRLAALTEVEKRYGQLTQALLENVNTFSRDDLIDVFQKYNDMEKISDIIGTLEERVSRGGYYSLFDV